MFEGEQKYSLMYSIIASKSMEDHYIRGKVTVRWRVPGLEVVNPSVLGFLFLHKHHSQDASWGGKGLFSLHFHTAVHHQMKSGLELKQIRKQELMQRPWRDVLYWLASPGLLSLLSYRTKTTSPEMVPPCL